MKPVKSIVLAMICILFTGCGGSTGNESALSAAGDPFDSADAFELIGLTPFVLSDGQLYRWELSGWQSFAAGGEIARIFGGEKFCALDDSGRIMTEQAGQESGEEDTGASLDEQEYFPLGSAATYYMAQRLVEISQSRPFRMLNKALPDENVIALCEDGEMITVFAQNAYEAVPIPFEEEVKALSGDFILTEGGDVYQVRFRESGPATVSRVSEDRIVQIAACPSAPRCIGIREDGTVVMWTDLEMLDLSEWSNIAAVEMGFNYCAGLAVDGSVYFAAYDAETEGEVSEYLAGKKATAIACSFQTLALLSEDRSVEILDF